MRTRRQAQRPEAALDTHDRPDMHDLHAAAARESPAAAAPDESAALVQNWLHSTAVSRRLRAAGLPSRPRPRLASTPASGPGPSRLRYSRVYDFDDDEDSTPHLDRAPSDATSALLVPDSPTAHLGPPRKRPAPSDPCSPAMRPPASKRPCSSSSSSLASVPSLTSASTASLPSTIAPLESRHASRLADATAAAPVPTIRVVQPDARTTFDFAAPLTRMSARSELAAQQPPRVLRKPLPASARLAAAGAMQPPSTTPYQRTQPLVLTHPQSPNPRWSTSTLQSSGSDDHPMSDQTVHTSPDKTGNASPDNTTISDELQEGILATPTSAVQVVQRMQAQSCAAAIGAAHDDHDAPKPACIAMPTPEQQRAALTRISLTPTRLFYCRATGRVNMSEAAVMEPALLALQRKAEREAKRRPAMA